MQRIGQPTALHSLFCDLANSSALFARKSVISSNKSENRLSDVPSELYFFMGIVVWGLIVNTHDQARRLISALLMLAVSALSTGARAERTAKSPDNAKLPSYIKTLEKKSYQSRKFSKRFKIKGWRVGEDLYVGGVKAAGDYGPGLVLDKGSYAWGFNHQGMEFQVRF